MSNENLRTALQDMVTAFNPYAWVSADNKKDALDEAMQALAEDDAEPVVKKDTSEFQAVLDSYILTSIAYDKMFQEHMGKGMSPSVYDKFTTMRDETLPNLLKQLVQMYAKD